MYEVREISLVGDSASLISLFTVSVSCRTAGERNVILFMWCDLQRT
jgi:hypothetical protein